MKPSTFAQHPRELPQPARLQAPLGGEGIPKSLAHARPAATLRLLASPRLRACCAVGAALVAAAALAAASAPPASAASNTGTTEVTVQADPDALLAFRVPTLIPFYAAADGTLTGPTPEATQIVNESVFGIHVVEAQVSAASPWTIASDAAAGSAENMMDFQFGPSTQLDAAAALSGSDTSADPSFNMGYQGSGSEAVSISTSGDVARVTVDLSTPQQTATIAWTVAPGFAE